MKFISGIYRIRALICSLLLVLGISCASGCLMYRISAFAGVSKHKLEIGKYERQYRDSIKCRAVEAMRRVEVVEKMLLTRIDSMNALNESAEINNEENMAKAAAQTINKKIEIVRTQLNRLLNGGGLDDCYSKIRYALDFSDNVVTEVNGSVVKLKSYCQRLRIMGSNAVSIKDLFLECGENDVIIKLVIKEINT